MVKKQKQICGIRFLHKFKVKLVLFLKNMLFLRDFNKLNRKEIFLLIFICEMAAEIF